MSVLDPLPPRLDRRGAAAARAKALAALDGSVAADLAVRGPARASVLRRLGLAGEAPDVLVAGDWLVPAVEEHRARLREIVGDGIAPSEAARALELEDPAVVEALVAPPLEYVDGRIRRAGATLPAELAERLAWLKDRLADNPFDAPTSDELSEAGLDAAAVATLHRGGHLLRLAPGVAVLPDAATQAMETLAALPQPFTTSQARQALGTSRRVVLPLLAYLDANADTVRLPDDTRRVTSRWQRA